MFCCHWKYDFLVAGVGTVKSLLRSMKSLLQVPRRQNPFWSQRLDLVILITIMLFNYISVWWISGFIFQVLSFVLWLHSYVQVDCDEHKGVCGKYGVSGYPTIKWFPKGSLEPKKWVYELRYIAHMYIVLNALAYFIISPPDSPLSILYLFLIDSTIQNLWTYIDHAPFLIDSSIKKVWRTTNCWSPCWVC